MTRRGKASVLAIDADPNSCLAESLGVDAVSSIVGVCEEISKNMDTIPRGMTKDRYIEMKVQESLIETEDFDLLLMGRPEGPGCYCYVNNLLRDIIGDITKSYDFIVIDNAAGMEHISRRTTMEITKLVLVSDYSSIGVRSARRIYDLAGEIGVKMSGAYLVINKMSGPLSAIKPDIEKADIEVAGEIPYSSKVSDWAVSNKPISYLADAQITQSVEEILDKILKGVR